MPFLYILGELSLDLLSFNINPHKENLLEFSADSDVSIKCAVIGDPPPSSPPSFTFDDIYGNTDLDLDQNSIDTSSEK